MAETAEATRTFTQADVDRIVSERLASEREQVSSLKRELGTAQNELEARNGDVDRLNRRVQSVEKERDDAREQAKTATEKSVSAQIRAQVTTEAVRAGAVDPDDVYALLPENAVTVNAETGDIEGVQKAVSELAEKKTHLFTPAPRPGPSDGGAREETGSPTRQPPSMTDLIRRNAGRET